MRPAEELEEKAREVLEMAASARTDAMRRTYLAIADQYRTMAAQKRELDAEAAQKRR